MRDLTKMGCKGGGACTKAPRNKLYQKFRLSYDIKLTLGNFETACKSTFKYYTIRKSGWPSVVHKIRN